MRRVLLALLLLTQACPALAGPAVIPAAPKAKPVPAMSVAPIDASASILPPPIPLASQRPDGDTAQCKASCAKTLYFCNAGGEDDGCGGRWAQCSASCSATYVTPRFTGAR